MTHFLWAVPVLAIAGGAQTPAQAAGCYNLAHGEPKELTGRLEYVIFAGPPNFEDVQKGDTPEPNFVLQLSHPICISGDEFADPRSHFRAVQIVETKGTAGQLRRLVHQTVTVSLSDPMAEVHLVEVLCPSTWDALVALKHPHVFGIRSANNTIYRGEGAMASSAPAELRLTRPGGPLSQWTVPPWLRERGLSYHGNPARWIGETVLHAVARGQEFVCDIGDDPQARVWVEHLIELIRA